MLAQHNAAKPEQEVEVPTTEVVVEEVVQTEPTPAQPYFYLDDYSRNIIERIVQNESGGESLKGQMLVAQCILNAMVKNDAGIDEVRRLYKYTRLASTNSVNDSVKEAVTRVFVYGEKVVDEPILFFYAPKYCSSSWHESQCFVIQEGGHRFFKEW